MPGYDPDCMITVIDASAAAFSAYPPRSDELMLAQLHRADVIVLNKIDIAGEDVAARTQHALSSVAPAARFVWSSHGRVAPSLLLGPSLDSHSIEDPMVTAEWRSDLMLKEKRASMVGESCRVWRLVQQRAISGKDFRRWVGHLPPTILRATGAVFVEEDPTHRHEFALIGSRWQLKRGAPWSEGSPETAVTLVGISTRSRAPVDPTQQQMVIPPPSPSSQAWTVM
jgi:G3E family GTPase